jgi:hypothetical protein
MDAMNSQREAKVVSGVVVSLATMVRRSFVCPAPHDGVLDLSRKGSPE